MLKTFIFITFFCVDHFRQDRPFTTDGLGRYIEQRQTQVN